MTQEELDLLHGFLADTLNADEFARLQALLRQSAEARRTLRTFATVDAKLQQLAAADPTTWRLLAEPTPAAPASSFAWASRSLVAAAAGLVLGMFCTSVVLGYIAPAWRKPVAVSLLDEGFESVETLRPTGVPVRTGEWSGDFAEIVGAQNGVDPHGGAKMWRFLRADNTLPEAQASYVAEAVHVIDLKPLRSAGVTLESQVEISAWFAQGEAPLGLRYHWNIKAAAFEGNVADAPMLWKKWDETIASLARREVPVGQSRRWQRLSVTLLLPANADFLVFECAVVQRQPRLSEGVAEFPAHYVDDVHVRLLPSTSEAPSLE
jgi:hypothetical protein